MSSSHPGQLLWEAGAADIPGGVCVPSLISAQSARQPEALAVRAGAEAMTYGELERKACCWASCLRSLGVGTDLPVGLWLTRTPQMVAAALGILKAGGAYMPIDPDCPAERAMFMLKDSGAPVLVTNACRSARLPAPRNGMAILYPEEVENFPSGGPHDRIRPGDLAYVIYTSGSTGAPKGVEVTHEGLANLVFWHRDAFAVAAQDRASHLAGLSFDAAVWELWPYLAWGASLHLADDVTRASPALLRDWIVESGITISFVPTPIAERMLALPWPESAALRILLTGGDRLREHPPSGLPFRVVNNYGPTECSVVATSGELLPEEERGPLPSIGRPITNTSIYLLDEHGSPVPPGTPGEMYISGCGVARGYRNRPELTAERFQPDPFQQPGRRMYRTGDMARLLPNGRLEFLGRVDDQIKIRGYRVEPGEIIATLGRHTAVRESLVVAREDTPDEVRLVGYVVLQPEASTTSSALREFLRESLPEYMIPAAFVSLREFPLTAHGKIDRTALPPPAPCNTLADGAPAAAPLTPTEKQVGKIVAGLLNRESVGRDDNFFLLGGHSLLGAQLLTRVRNEFGVEISLRTLFGGPTVSRLAHEIDRLSGGCSTQCGLTAA